MMIKRVITSQMRVSDISGCLVVMDKDLFLLANGK